MQINCITRNIYLLKYTLYMHVFLVDSICTIVYNITNKDCTIANQGAHQLTVDRQTIQHTGLPHRTVAYNNV